MNQRQYRIAKAWLDRFERDLRAHDAVTRDPKVHPRIHEAAREALISEAEELRSQLRRYEQLRDGEVTGRETNSLRDLPIALIEGRIAARLTQRMLAERLGVVQQQVQRWESSSYAGVGLDRLQDIADALGMTIHETVTYTVG